VSIAGETVHLLAQRALFWPAEKTLFIADPHFGKSATFRSFGIAAPDETEEDLKRLDTLMSQLEPRRVVILGDSLHARAGKSNSMLSTIYEWQRRRAVEMLLVRGNHDRAAGDPPSDWAIECVGEGWRAGPFVRCHEPCDRAEDHVFAGHIHPGFSLRERTGGGLRAPCFVVTKQVTLFPAFGSFTGLSSVAAEPNQQIFAMNGNTILKVWDGYSALKV
jgi:DNA ligase-associated metallophosphoesterase